MTDTVSITVDAVEVVTIGSPDSISVSVDVMGPQGPSGTSGSASNSTRIDQSTASSTWILSHTLGRIPTCQVYLTNGEIIFTDVICTSTTITVTFPSPVSGFVMIN